MAQDTMGDNQLRVGGSLSRRDFIKGAGAAAALGVATIGVGAKLLQTVREVAAQQPPEAMRPILVKSGDKLDLRTDGKPGGQPVVISYEPGVAELKLNAAHLTSSSQAGHHQVEDRKFRPGKDTVRVLGQVTQAKLVEIARAQVLAGTEIKIYKSAGASYKFPLDREGKLYGIPVITELVDAMQNGSSPNYEKNARDLPEISGDEKYGLGWAVVQFDGQASATVIGYVHDSRVFEQK